MKYGKLIFEWKVPPPLLAENTADMHERYRVPEAYRVWENQEAIHGVVVEVKHCGEWISNPPWNTRALVKELLQRLDPWIAALDRLPTTREYVMARNLNAGSTFSAYPFVAWYCRDRGIWQNPAREEQAVTHWHEIIDPAPINLAKWKNAGRPLPYLSRE